LFCSFLRRRVPKLDDGRLPAEAKATNFLSQDYSDSCADFSPDASWGHSQCLMSGVWEGKWLASLAYPSAELFGRIGIKITRNFLRSETVAV
jgi:hypothetical protein